MDRISGISRILETLNKKVSDNSTRPTRTKSSNSTYKTEKSTIEELESQLVDRFKDINLNDETELSSSYSVFLESVFSWEFGDKLTQDPGFHNLIHDVCNTINEDKALRDKFNTVIKQLTQ